MVRGRVSRKFFKLIFNPQIILFSEMLPVFLGLSILLKPKILLLNKEILLLPKKNLKICHLTVNICGTKSSDFLIICPYFARRQVGPEGIKMSIFFGPYSSSSSRQEESVKFDICLNFGSCIFWTCSLSFQRRFYRRTNDAICYFEYWQISGIKIIKTFALLLGLYCK